MRKKRKTEKVGEDESGEEESTDDSEEEKQPALESAVDEQNVAGTSAVRSEMETASRVLADALSSTNQPIEKGAGGKDSSNRETDLSEKELDNAEDSESEEVSEEDGEEGNLWGAILGPKQNN